MRNHWDCTAWADKLRVMLGGIPKPKSASWDGWDEWKEEAQKHKLAWLVVDVGLDKVQAVVTWPSYRFNDLRSYCKNRWGDKLHYLPTRLEPGKYYEVDTRLMHGMFETLVDFIECEKAWMHVVFESEEERRKYPGLYKPWYMRWKAFRCPEAGIAHLLWEMTLENEAPSQAAAANEELVLYNWWKHERPARGDAWVVSGLREIYEGLDSKYGSGWLLSDKKVITASERLIYNDARDKEQALEEKWEREDEAMMIRLIKIRKNLWT